MLAAILRWVTGDLIGQLLRAYQMRLAADTDEKKFIADAAMKSIEAQMQAKAQATEIRLATSGFWEMRLITATIAGCFTLHLLLVTLDTCFSFGWGVPKFPSPFDEWQGTILLSFFGVQVAGQGFIALAAAIRRR